MNISIAELLLWAKKSKKDMLDKKVLYEEKHKPKIEAYLDMIIARCDIILKQDIQQKIYMENIEDGLIKLEARGVSLPQKKEENQSKDLEKFAPPERKLYEPTITKII